MAELQIDLAAAGEKDLLVFALAQRGIDAHGLMERRLGPALDEPERRTVAQIERRGLGITALAGDDAIAEAGAQVGKGAERVRGGRGYECIGQIVDEAAFENGLAALLDRQIDLGFAVERGRVGPGALDGDLRWCGQAQSVKENREADERVPGQHGVA